MMTTPMKKRIRSMQLRQVLVVAFVFLVLVFSPPPASLPKAESKTLACESDSNSQLVIHSAPPNTNFETWDIQKPMVRQAWTEYPQIQFQAGDRVTLTAGGCVQTGGSGKTWKRYVDPQDFVFDNRDAYYGSAEIPIAMPAPMRLKALLGRPIDMPGGSYLRLGYADDDYSDNGYCDRNGDNGTHDQCLGIDNAWVHLTVVHANDMLSGVWFGDDGATYYLHQEGSLVWWAGMSEEDVIAGHDLVTTFQQGLRFTNVFEGKVDGGAGVISGEWADVPRGSTLGNGSLTLAITAPDEIRKREEHGSHFGATVWRKGSSVVPLFNSTDVAGSFFKIMRNDQGSMAHHMTNGQGDNQGLFRDNTVVYGTLKSLPVANFPGNNASITFFDQTCPFSTDYRFPRIYPYFMCADFCPYKWFNGSAITNNDPPDGDVHFDVQLSRPLNLTPGTDWYNPPSIIGDRLQQYGNLAHAELTMYNRTANANQCAHGDDYPSLLPGWADGGGNSVLINGQPLNGADFSRVVIGTEAQVFTNGNASSNVERVLDWTLVPPESLARCRATQAKCLTLDQPVRITGVLALDEHSGNKVEIHPVYSIDIIQPTLGAPLTGIWGADDDATYYVRHIGNAVWWLGLSRDRGLTFANVFHGILQGNGLSGEWSDVPLGTFRNHGTLNLSLDANRINLSRLVQTGNFGAQSWDKLYDQNARIHLPMIQNRMSEIR